jgi:hypothetical protein
MPAVARRGSHSAVLAYIDPPRRRQFADTVRGLGAVWLSNEGTAVLPHIATPPHDRDSFVFVRDGTTPVAFTDPHGTWLHWLHWLLGPLERQER